MVGQIQENYERSAKALIRVYAAQIRLTHKKALTYNYTGCLENIS